ncbi:MAG: TonB-dependent receptor [Gemmatimonadota bacterium]
MQSTFFAQPRARSRMLSRTPSRLLITLCALLGGTASTAHGAPQPGESAPAPDLAAAPVPSREPAVIGTVRDTAGAPIGNVQVVVSGVNRNAITDDRGEFVLRGLPAGTYHIDLVRIGYVGEHQVVVVPETGPDVRVTIVMRVATVRLSSVNVTATPTGADLLNVTQATVQLSGKELQRALSTSVGGTLAGEPGMASRYSGPLANAPVIRGLTGERVLVLQDGERAGDLSSAASDHLNAVDPSSAERIEVIRGPASLLYGNSAIGGVVNVISNEIPTSVPGRMSGYVLGQGESVTPGGVGAAGLLLPLGKSFAITARGGFRQFESLRVGGGFTQPNTDGSTNYATVGGGFVGSHASVGVVYRQMDFEYGLPFADGEEQVRLDGIRRMAALQSTVHTGFAPISSVRIDGTVQSYKHDEIEDTGEIGTRFRLKTQTANVLARTHFGSMGGAIGVQGLFRQYAPAGDEAFTPGADNDNIAAYIYQEFPFAASRVEGARPQLQFGARYDYFSIATKPRTPDDEERFGTPTSRSYSNVAASVGLSVPLAPDVSITGNISRGFRAPTVEELFANGFHAAVGTFDVGNATLDPEQSTGFEAGLRASSGRTFAQLNGYYDFIDRYIAPRAVGMQDVDGSDVPLVNYVQADAKLYGAEAQIETKLPYSLVGGLLADFTRASFRDGSGNLPYIPAARLGGSLRYDNGKFSAGGDARRVFGQTRVSGDALDLPTDAYTMINVSTSWLFTVKGSTVHSLTLRADNVLDEQYRDATSRIKSFAFNPGRNLSVVYKLLF